MAMKPHLPRVLALAAIVSSGLAACGPSRESGSVDSASAMTRTVTDSADSARRADSIRMNPMADSTAGRPLP